MTSKHTPGRFYPGSESHCSLNSQAMTLGEKEDNYNCNLMAAAPDMYDALLSAIAIMEHAGMQLSWGYKRAEEAIAKAEGRV